MRARLTVSGVEVVDVGVSERAAGDGVAADTDRGNGADHVEDLKELSLRDGDVELSDVERSRGRRVGGRLGGSDRRRLGRSSGREGDRGGGLLGRGLGLGLLLGLLLDGGGGGRGLVGWRRWWRASKVVQASAEKYSDGRQREGLLSSHCGRERASKRRASHQPLQGCHQDIEGSRRVLDWQEGLHVDATTTSPELLALQERTRDEFTGLSRCRLALGVPGRWREPLTRGRHAGGVGWGRRGRY